jgi:hypothetical protein
MLYKRIDQGKQEQPQWVEFVYPIMLTHNNKMIHSSIKMTPYAATKPSNAIDVTKTHRITSIIYQNISRARNREYC